MNDLKMKDAFLLFLLVFVLFGCAGQRAFMAGRELMQAGKYDEAVAEYFRAVNREPGNKEYRMRLLEARTLAAQGHLKQGRILASQENYRGAALEFEQAAALDPSADVARNELKMVKEKLRAEDLAAEGEQFYRMRKLNQAKAAANEALQLRPGYEPARLLLEKIQGERKPTLDGHELDVTSNKPITLKFKDADVRDVFNILSKLSGINFIFDEEIRSQKVSVLLEDASFAQALELLLNMNKLNKKVLNPKTIIVYPKTKEKEKQFEDQLIQTFYLSNIDAKKAVNLLRTMLQLRKIYVHEELNALVIRDTPEVIKLAQQVIEAADRGDSEVLFDLELIEVNHTDDLNIGPKLGTYSVSAGLADPGSGKIVASTLSPGSDTANLVSGFSRLESFYTLPTATFDFLKKRSDAEVLANPKIRVKNKEKAKVLVGTREPVITVTRTGGTTGDFSENVQYVDVGVKLDIEPVIQLDESIVTKLNLEVSSVSGRQTTSGGSQVITITTTNAQTGLTLKDGERTVIGGLMRDDSTNSRSTIPFIGDLPILGDLLTSYTRNKTKREILLSITPRIVKNIEMPRQDVASIWSGGEEDLRAGQTFGAFAVPVEKEPARPSAAPAPAPAPLTPSPVTPPPLAPTIQAPAAPGQETRPEPVMPESETTPPGEPAPPPETGEATGVPAPAPEELPISEEPEVAPDAVAREIPPESGTAPAEQPPVPPETPAVPGMPPAPPNQAGEAASIPPLEIPPEESRLFMTGPAQVAAGTEFSVEVTAAGVRNLYSAPLFVTYDPQLLEFVRAEEGDFLKQQGQSTIFTSSANPATGRLIVGYKQGVGGTGASGGGTLFRLAFRAKAAGTASLGLDRVNFRDPAGNRLPVTSAGLTVEVRQP